MKGRRESLGISQTGQRAEPEGGKDDGKGGFEMEGEEEKENIEYEKRKKKQRKKKMKMKTTLDKEDKEEYYMY